MSFLPRPVSSSFDRAGFLPVAALRISAATGFSIQALI